MEIQTVPVSRLNPSAYNPRVDLKPGDREYEKLRRSMTEFGYVEPVIWNRQTGNIVGGHQRYKVLTDLGLNEIECVVVDLPLEKEKALNIALNRIQGAWDETKLASLMAEFDASDFDVSLTGFDADEVDALLNKFYSHDAVEDGFDRDKAREEIEKSGGPVSVPGTAWKLGEHILVCGSPGDRSVYDGLMKGETAQCAFTVPPADPEEYAGHGIQPWLDRMLAVIQLLARFTGIICWQACDLARTGSQFIEPLFVHSVRLFADCDLRPLWTRVWKMSGNAPAAGALQAASNKPVNQFSFVGAFAGNETETYNDQEYSWLGAFAAHSFQFVKRLTRDERRRWGYSGVWEIPAALNGRERTVPVELPWRCIKMHSDPHGIVLDPFAGTGSTLLACEQAGRRCRAIERDPLNCDMTVRRWEQWTGEKAGQISL